MEKYGCTICHTIYDDFILAIYCCDDVDKQGDNFFTVNEAAPVAGSEELT